MIFSKKAYLVGINKISKIDKEMTNQLKEI